ncbi:UNVERIFIED_CONTAM: DDT domain-containing protein PTM [Sesamum calycinum]|uniref:DDT domain-containing protein PTM n=1 Tax=Sesamum calycinum TaxID=2727403 RepID=A0AAW2SG16_9LAMI
MEPAVVGCQRRLGRKRKIDNVQNMMVDCSGKKRIVETSSKVKAFLMEDADLTGEWSEKRQKLDESLLKKDVNQKVLKVDNGREPEKSNLGDSSLLSKMMNGDAGGSEAVKVHDHGNGDVDVDSLSDSCEDPRGGDANLDMEMPLVPPPELPPSSGHIGIQEEYVSHLLSVYSFLRSFSVPLFLYPFGLDDFVGAINSSSANTLLDSVHVALMRVLKHHLQRLSSDGSELASKCLRYVPSLLL